MAFTPEIKNFIKNTIIFTLIFAVVIHFSWEYFSSLSGSSAQAHNNANFENANISYVGNSATALSLRIGGIIPQKNTNLSNNSVDNIISIAEVLNNPVAGQEKLIASNMTAITAYANILKTDIVAMLDTAANRQASLDNHISLLKSYYLKTQERLNIIGEQKTEVQSLLTNATNAQNTAKNTLQNSYNVFEYSGVNSAINDYLDAKNLDSRMKIYAIYLDRFEKSYLALQNKNRKILDALMNNREGIIRKSMVVIPDTGTDIIKELGLIQSEADYKAKQALQ
ncbi:MAG: hypothetical protein ACTTH6_00470 [Candidatus Altimarinota bacterium]|nr:hypothetical protein [Candidatus Gracilibacteria bacterium]